MQTQDATFDEAAFRAALDAMPPLQAERTRLMAIVILALRSDAAAETKADVLQKVMGLTQTMGAIGLLQTITEKGLCDKDTAKLAALAIGLVDLYEKKSEELGNIFQLCAEARPSA